jgi:CPA2 family monovalent cation:H+ antiporter-2/glutathione-regulated potassium-efflux system protein KefB
LESDLEPFKGLLLGLFFLAVGASIDFKMISERPWAILGVVSGIVFIKMLVLLITGRIFQLKKHETYFFHLASHR